MRRSPLNCPVSAGFKYIGALKNWEYKWSCAWLFKPDIKSIINNHPVTSFILYLIKCITPVRFGTELLYDMPFQSVPLTNVADTCQTYTPCCAGLPLNMPSQPS